MKIVMQRAGALGDVLCITPVLAKLRRDYPHALIQVDTRCPEVIRDHDALVPPALYSTGGGIKTFALGLAYERRPSMHILDAYFEVAFGHRGLPDEYTLQMKHTGPWTNRGAVIVHAARSWASRTFAPRFWDTVALELKNMGLRPIFVGAQGDYRGPLWASSAVGMLSLAQVGALIQGASLFVGSDSSLIHIAGTTETPIIGLYTCVRAAYRMPHRHGVLGWNMIGLEPRLDCVGCLETKPAPVTDMRCGRGDNLCVSSIQPSSVRDAAEKLLG